MIDLLRRSPRLLLLVLSVLAAFLWFLLAALPGDAVLPGLDRPRLSLPALAEGEEGCLACHGAMAGFAPAHDPTAIGCSSCHLGQPGQMDKDAAHEGMVLVPGNLADVHLTCGTANCHADIAQRVEGSLMASMSGVITVNRFVFGESNTLSAHAHVRDLSLDSPADTHLRQLCASCHLGNHKQAPGPVTDRSRGGGCIACHLDYNADALAASQAYHQGLKKEGLRVHPAINLNVSNSHCFGCHSRSGRISTSYEGWHETRLSPGEVAGKQGYRVLGDQRVFEFIAPDIHHSRGLECIDCHSAQEVMGDGISYFHEEEQAKLQCSDCHFVQAPHTVPFDSLDVESKKILGLRHVRKLDDPFIVGRYSGRALLNVRLDSQGVPYMTGKNSGKKHPLKAPAQICTRGQAHQALSCSACHTAWSPQCVGCHTAYAPENEGYDLLAKKKVKGKWEEYLGVFFPEAPTLGIVEEMSADSQLIRRVKAFIPGMIMTIDKSRFPGRDKAEVMAFHRLFAPAASHTTNTGGRTCRSCHSNPLALGYGRGQLEYRVDGHTGSWSFEPEYAAEERDGLPQDAWVGFLQYPKGVSTTRPNARPFSIAEQKRVLTVGACLSCHEESSGVMMQCLDDFQAALKKKSPSCIMPVYPGWQQ